MSEQTGRDKLLTTISRIPPPDVDEGSNAANDTGHDLPVSGEESFDRVVVQELRRVITEESTHDLREPPQNTRPASFASSAITLSGFNLVDGFDLDKTLRLVVKK
jgi:hypothetical protein